MAAADDLKGCFMTRFRKSLLVLLAILGALWLYKPFFPSASYREKLSITVTTPDGPVRGSAVIKVRHSMQPVLAQAGGHFVDYTGEAVMVDLGAGQYLFALLPHMAALSAYEADGRIGEFHPFKAFRGYFFKLKYFTSHAPAEVPRNLYPRLVTFTDITDPTSVTLVDPDNLAASFGPGTTLERITVAITNAPVTEGVVEGVLPEHFFKAWGALSKAALAKGIDDPYYQTLAGRLHRGDFLKGALQ
jgi:hypothetical protein